MRSWLAIVCGLLLLPGCVVIKVSARNPIPEMTTIAVAPFFNLTQEPNSVVDGRRFALAYYAELQKTQGFEVIPVGVVESMILQHRLELQNPGDALKLCELLNADAIVVGAVTDYDPYYPPRIGLQVDWYSPKSWKLPATHVNVPEEAIEVEGGGWCRPRLFRGQSPGDVPYPPENDSVDVLPSPPIPQSVEDFRVKGPKPEGEMPKANQPMSAPEDGGRRLNPSESPAPMTRDLPLRSGEGEESEVIPLPEARAESVQVPEGGADRSGGVIPPAIPGMSPTREMFDAAFDPTQPLMSYTRHFDGADAEDVNKLRDYLELRGDRRSGGWEEYLHRSEDFIRFVSHVMIVEMLSVHGGANRTQVVIKWRKYR